MRGEILSVGTELLLGSIVDTNAAFLGRELATLGIDTYYVSAVGDNLVRLTEAFRRGWQRSEIIVVTGGLGPTEDDLTREAISALLDEPMVVQPELECELRAFFARRNVAMPERNVKQATLIQSARAIPNPVGTAPGWWVDRDGHIIVAMPGVPSEMTRMWTNEVKPRLQAYTGGMVIYSRTLKVVGIGESTVEEMLGELTHSLAPTVATYAKRDGIHVRLTTKARTTTEAEQVIGPMEEQIRCIFGPALYGVDDESLAAATTRLLAERDLKLGIVEVGTAGSVAAELLPVLPAHLLNEARVLSASAGNGAEDLTDLARGARQWGQGPSIGMAVRVTVLQQDPPIVGVSVAVDDGDIQRSTRRTYNASWEQARLRVVNDALHLIRGILFTETAPQ
ncbi:MAG: CinA family nicotinamide mononucleotide deamidase-related protein [Chloroflexi bacterium]|nr:CinA family nicotinamide mononucleotide deamidase-related protein [Chloroflexota bacterium]